MFVIVFGIQGSGKGTQGEMLAEKIGIPHLSTGELVRSIATQDTAEGREIKEIIEKGYLLSDERMTEILKRHLPHEVILDGYPRTLVQAEHLEELAHVDFVIHFALSEKEAMRRALARGRSDDTPDAIKLRMQQYHAQADKILEYYEKQGLLRTVDGDKSPEDVFKEVCEIVGI